MNPGDPQEDHFDASAMPTLLRRFFPFYCALAALATFGYALYDSYQMDGDAVAYMDLGDLLRAHQWAVSEPLRAVAGLVCCYVPPPRANSVKYSKNES